MPKNDSLPQESTQHSSKQEDHAREFKAVQAVIAAKLAEKAKVEKANQPTIADLEAIKF